MGCLNFSTALQNRKFPLLSPRQVTPGSPPVWELSTAVGTGQHSIPAAESTGITIVRAHFPKPAKSCTAAARFNRLPLLFPLYIPVVSFLRKNSAFFHNFPGFFIDASFRHKPSYAGKRIHLGISSDHRSGIQNGIAAYFHMVAQNGSHFFPVNE